MENMWYVAAKSTGAQSGLDSDRAYGFNAAAAMISGCGSSNGFQRTTADNLPTQLFGAVNGSVNTDHNQTNQQPVPGTLARLGVHVSCFEDSLRAQKGGNPLTNLIKHGLVRKRRNIPPPVRSNSDQVVLTVDEDDGLSPTEKSHLRSESDSDSRSSVSSCSNVGVSPAQRTNFADVSSHVRAFLDRRTWNTCVIEWMLPDSKASSVQGGVQRVEQLNLTEPLGWQRFRQICATEDAMARGWVCRQLKMDNAVLIRITAVEVPASSEAMLQTPVAPSAPAWAARRTKLPFETHEQLDWMIPPQGGDGLLGVLRAEDAELPTERLGSGGSSNSSSSSSSNSSSSSSRISQDNRNRSKQKKRRRARRKTPMILGILTPAKVTAMRKTVKMARRWASSAKLQGQFSVLL